MFSYLSFSTSASLSFMFIDCRRERERYEDVEASAAMSAHYAEDITNGVSYDRVEVGDTQISGRGFVFSHLSNIVSSVNTPLRALALFLQGTPIRY